MSKRTFIATMLICISMILSSISGIIACNRISKLEAQVAELEVQVEEINTAMENFSVIRANKVLN